MTRKISLDDKYRLSAVRTYLTGIEALVRLPILQRQRDEALGLDTAGFITGYRGSPLGSLDQALWRAQEWLARSRIRFSPGVNEDLAATAVWGAQQVHLLPQPKQQGVFAMWYGKGPGVDRSMDVIKHGNAFGTSEHGGVLLLAGDDHACKSSTLPHQSEHLFIAAAVPVLNPANVQEVLDYGILGWGLSRYSGCWVAMKSITETMDSGQCAEIDPARVNLHRPQDVALPPGGLNAQWPATPLAQEARLHRHRIYAARAFALANDLNTVTLDTPNARLGIVTSGKSHLDVLEALDGLGIGPDEAVGIGLRIYKVGMSWPLEPVATHRFARGLKEILVVEEKRSIIEDQLTSQLYNWPVADRPVVVGEYDEHQQLLLGNLGELDPAQVMRAIGKRILNFHDSPQIRARLEALDVQEARLNQVANEFIRQPYFCSGCPHNNSTKLPEGSVGLAGIGCHYMVKWMDRNTELFTQMGGEGASWIGQAPFTDTPHVFQNLGDGTYFHSGILAIRAAVAAGVNITYKILYNDAVAMTGGQPVDGGLNLRDIAMQVYAEGVRRIAVVAEDVADARARLQGLDYPTFHARADYARLQDELRRTPGATAILYAQTCAAEKRRRRKRGRLALASRRVFINAAVCEGCGDCSRQSNCLSVLPKQTAFGLKREIDQSACNADYSCLDGFCPSFITVTGAAKPAAPAVSEEPQVLLPDPPLVELERPWNMLVTGVGGTGVLTVASLVAVAAQIEGKGCSTLNQTGLAQKFGAVVSHVRVAAEQEQLHTVRIANGKADLLLGCDLVVAASPESLARLEAGRSTAVVDSYQTPTADFIHNPDYQFPGEQLRELIEREAGSDRAVFIDATRLARGLLGDAIGVNLFLLGFAYQRGLLPVGAEAIAQSIRLNNVAVDFNLRAFKLGRAAAVNVAALLARLPEAAEPEAPNTLADLMQQNDDYLRAYQDAAYADRYRTRIEAVQAAEQRIAPESDQLTRAAAQSLFRLMAYKDEYEVARLHTDSAFRRYVREQFGARAKIRFHLAPPILAKTDRFTGQPLKRSFPGRPMLWGMAVLARMKRLRGTPLDPFGRTAERRTERALIREYTDDLERLAAGLTPDNLQAAADLAALPAQIKGFGHIKLASIERYRKQREGAWRRFEGTELNLVQN